VAKPRLRLPLHREFLGHGLLGTPHRMDSRALGLRQPVHRALSGGGLHLHLGSHAAPRSLSKGAHLKPSPIVGRITYFIQYPLKPSAARQDNPALFSIGNNPIAVKQLLLFPIC